MGLAKPQDDRTCFRRSIYYLTNPMEKGARRRQSLYTLTFLYLTTLGATLAASASFVLVFSSAG